MNIVILEGNLGADPDLRYTQAGAAVLNMSLATTYKFKRGDDWDERTDWHRCEVWNKRAEALAKILVKGSRILIRGNIRYGSYEDKDGIKRYTTTIGIDELTLIGGKTRDRDSSDREDRRSNSRNGSKNESRTSNRRQQEQQERRDDTPNFDDGADPGDDDIPFDGAP